MKCYLIPNSPIKNIIEIKNSGIGILLLVK